MTAVRRRRRYRRRAPTTRRRRCCVCRAPVIKVSVSRGLTRRR